MPYSPLSAALRIDAAASRLRLPFANATAETLRFAEIWCGWRGDRLMPSRADLNLGDIKDLLPMIMLLEIRSPTEIVFRVAGSRLRDYLGLELTGRNYIDLAPPESRYLRIWRMQQQMDYPCGSLLIYQHAFPSGHIGSAETISLPIGADGAGRYRTILSLNTPLAGHTEEMPHRPDTPIHMATRFGFVDIGAGAPGRIEP